MHHHVQACFTALTYYKSEHKSSNQEIICRLIDNETGCQLQPNKWCLFSDFFFLFLFFLKKLISAILFLEMNFCSVNESICHEACGIVVCYAHSLFRVTVPWWRVPIPQRCWVGNWCKGKGTSPVTYTAYSEIWALHLTHCWREQWAATAQRPGTNSRFWAFSQGYWLDKDLHLGHTPLLHVLRVFDGGGNPCEYWGKHAHFTLKGPPAAGNRNHDHLAVRKHW